MFCHKCGNKSPGGAGFCQKCGTKLMVNAMAQPVSGEPITSVTPEPTHQELNQSNPTEMEPQQVPSGDVAAHPNKVVVKITRILFFIGVISGAMIVLSTFIVPIRSLTTILIFGVVFGIIGNAMSYYLNNKKVKAILMAAVGVTMAVIIIVALSVGNSIGGNRYVQMVRGGSPVTWPNTTYGEAFNNFFGNPRWSHFESDDSQQVVEFTGDMEYGGTPVNALIQFVIDAENGTFEATFLSFNEVPQTQMMLWTLINTVFGEVGGTHQQQLPSSQQQTIGERIIIGETRTYDVAGLAGVVEVTLEYAEFASRAPSPWGGLTGDHWEQPDPGNTFLRLEFTVRNVGTTSSSFMPGLGTLVYDSIFEFDLFVSDPLISLNQNALSAAETVTAYYMVPDRVIESNGALVIRFGSTEAVDMSFVIRPGAGAGQPGIPATAPGELLFEGISVMRFLDYTMHEIVSMWGQPWEQEGFGGSMLHHYGDITFFTDFFDEMGAIVGVSIEPRAVEVDGVSLDRNRDGIIALLGPPTSEDTVEFFGHFIEYGNITIVLESPESVAVRIDVFSWY